MCPTIRRSRSFEYKNKENFFILKEQKYNLRLVSLYEKPRRELKLFCIGTLRLQKTLIRLPLDDLAKFTTNG